MRGERWYRRLAALLALANSGCATMVHGRTQIVPVTSMPPGATVTLQPGGESLTTPGSLVLARKSSYVARISKPGYVPLDITLRSTASSALWRNLVWIHPVGWAVGIGIDLGNGSGYELEPESISVTLPPDSSPQATGSPPLSDESLRPGGGSDTSPAPASGS